MQDNDPNSAKNPSVRSGRRKPEVATNAIERRIVTALCYDLVDSTELFHRMDLEDYRELISAFQSAANKSIAAHSGVLRVEAGDGGLALFPIDLGPRDAASLAIRAGLQIVETCRHIGEAAGRADLQVRVGIATSIALVQGPQAQGWSQEPVVGVALALATRLETVAAPNTVFVSDETCRLAGRSHAFSFEGIWSLKGFEAPERAWRALGHKNEVDRFYAFGRLGSPFVGRTDELGRLSKAWKGVLAGSGQTVVIEGDAGIGKSRLLHEFRRLTRAERSKSFLFQCVPGGFHSTLHPLVNSLTGMPEMGGQSKLTASTVAGRFRRHGIRQDDIIEIFAYILGAEGRSESLASINPKLIRDRAKHAISQALRALCESGPVLIVVEDIHWIDPTSREFLMEAARIIPGLPILLIATMRPGPTVEWLEETNPLRLLLRPLGADETRLAIERNWPPHRQAEFSELFEVAERISGGVPLFIEQICQWVSETKVADQVTMPKTASTTHISAFEEILEARLGQLGPIRDVARAGAVAGSRFTLPLLRRLLPDYGKKALANAADTLCDTGFVTHVRAGGTVIYGFRHALIQETIYKLLLRRQSQTLHRRLFDALSEDPTIAPWIDVGSRGEHAEHAGLKETAVGLFISAGQEAARRSALAEARHHLEHALSICDDLEMVDRIDRLRLSAVTALGPVLAGAVGTNSPPARKLYEEGVEIANRQPLEEKSRWFPIYWGWWLTGSDFLTMHERAMEVQVMLAGVQDPEIRLQMNHCVWAIDFNLGRHRETQNAIREGLALYDIQRASEARTIYGGHDARVCGLGQLALSLWLTGHVHESDRVLQEMIQFANEISHLPSKAHSLDTEAVSAFYRNDYKRLAAVSEEMSEFAKQHEMQSLAGLSLLFGGWAEAHLGNLAGGYLRFCEGFDLLGELGAVIDLPIYLSMQAAMIGLDGKIDRAIEVASEAIHKARETGHAYWLAELYRVRAMLHARAGAMRNVVMADLDIAAETAQAQGAAALQQRIKQSIEELGLVVDR
ncbi:ATP-binding protein [Rhizobium mesoamericanum]|uniref:ATP-binding protein n=1 Tax=Rhizobium mesoamericanum TaxID=1079800 RepID=UPI000424AC80|nr:AAA family ATPase [Rhizobium mesoamericanum]